MWLKRLSPLFVPVYDYVLMTEPLTPDQRASIGWEGRFGMSDSGNQFHYFRLSADDRILWGGYDAIYHAGNRVSPAHDLRADLPTAPYDALKVKKVVYQAGDVAARVNARFEEINESMRLILSLIHI